MMPTEKISDQMAQNFVLWLHGLGKAGPSYEQVKTLFTAPEFISTKLSFPTAPSKPSPCDDGEVRPSWFDIYEQPITADSLKDEDGVLKAVQDIHEMIDKVISHGMNPENVFLCGFSQGGALTLASVLLYPKTLGGGAVFSGWVPFSDSIMEHVTPDAKQTPILWCHGTDDNRVRFEVGEAVPPFLEKAGVSCEFKAYANLDHSVNDEELRSLASWIKSRLQNS